MKMFCVFILCCLLLCGVNFAPLNVLDLNYIFGNAETEVFVEEYDEQQVGMVKNGTGGIFNAKLSSVKDISKTNKVLGYTIKLEGVELSDVLKEIKIVTYFENSFGLYGFVPNLFPPINAGGNLYNVQLVKNENMVLIGVPVLLGGY